MSSPMTRKRCWARTLNGADTDGDGLDDGAEHAEGTDPLDGCDPDPTSDSCDQDEDGLSKTEEVALGTNPLDADSDDDGV